MTKRSSGYTALALSVVALACKDAWDGDRDAARAVAEWAEILDRVGVTDAETVRRWAENPQPPQGLRTADVAERLGWTENMVYAALYREDEDLGYLPLPAVMIPFGRRHYLINKQDAAWYERAIGENL